MTSASRAALRPLFGSLVALSFTPVAHALSVDLSTANSSGTVNGALFTQVDLTAADVGPISDVLRIQGRNTGGAAVGYNTDGPTQFDEKANFTHSLLLSALPIVIKNGVAYREFLLNNNEPNASGKDLISLDGFDVFLSPNGTPTGVNLLNPAAALGVQVYSLDAGGDNAVVMNASLSRGSNHYDVAIDIPNAAFTNANTSNLYVTILATLGITNASGGSFDQFSIGTFSATLPPGDGGGGGGGTPIPLPGAALTGLSTLALLASIKWVRRVGS